VPEADWKMESGSLFDMNKIVFPGTFDPFTVGHLSVAERAAGLCGQLVIAVFDNGAKSPLMTRGERADLIRKAVGHLEGVLVEEAGGLLVDFCHERGIRLIVRGIRNSSQLEEEAAMAALNRRLGQGIETLFIPALPEHQSISSTAVREIARLGAEIGDLVPPSIRLEVAEVYGVRDDRRSGV